jgi:hypothetical protein
MCHGIANRAPAIAALAQSRHFLPWSREELAAIPLPTVMGALPRNFDKPIPNPPQVVLKPDVVLAWWLDRSHQISLIYREANQPALGGPGLTPVPAQRWRFCKFAGHIANAQAVIAPTLSLLSLDKNCEGMIDRNRQKLLLSQAALCAPAPDRPTLPDWPSYLTVEFDRAIKLPGKFSDDLDLERPAGRARLLQAARQAANFTFTRETSSPGR